ncbi:hypothetical protein ABMA27_004271 [Loxostege sticticalis]|uniref:O-acyltransferase WSD1 C-terminal domain-containing protein n=1 Tax=Loxostege sticticalis TaxID=481309 RepID=A0ABR3HN09_LOXSC
MYNPRLYLNCSVSKVSLSENASDGTNMVIRQQFTTESNNDGLGTITAFTAIIAGILINAILHYSFCKSSSVVLKRRFLNTKTVSRILALLVLVISLPLVILFLVLALCYKLLCLVIIRRRDKHFVGFLDSFDVFWSLEDDATINVIGVIESDSPEKLVNNIKVKLQNIAVANNGIDKIFYRRNEEYGFYYWRKYSLVDVSQYVEVIDLPDKSELTVVDLEDVMDEISNQSLPYENEGLFKIFVTKQRMGNQDDERGEYGIIFVIHHSVGDGVALLEFLCETLADRHETHPVNMFAVPEARINDTPAALMDMMLKLCEIPLCFVDTILRKPDENSLHGPSLLGKKSFRWTESDENLLAMVKEIKDNVDNLNFSDILATALSSGLHNYFTKTMAHVPEDLAVIVPVRFPKSSSINPNLLMKNDFSVTILDLPIKDKRNLNEIKSRCDNLRKSADPLSNHYFIKLVSILPRQILQPLLNSTVATMVFSNMPGPDQLSICGGNVLKELVFFVPHKGNTGLDVTALCYGGVLRLAASADRALIPDPEHLSFILDGMVCEIKRLHHQYARK